MRSLLVTLLVAGLAAAAALAQDKKEPAPKKPAVAPRSRAESAVTLKVGDAAPALKASQWLQGDEVKGFESGQTYVVEFWATWCGPCIVMMPHMAEMQAQYKDKGVRFIGYTAKDPNNGEEKVTQFVKKRGPKLKYTFAYSDDRETYNAWMQAAGQGGIPCSFVVDKAGKIAFIGHPLYLDVAAPGRGPRSWRTWRKTSTKRLPLCAAATPRPRSRPWLISMGDTRPWRKSPTSLARKSSCC